MSLPAIQCSECGLKFKGPSRDAQDHMNGEHDGEGILRPIGSTPVAPHDFIAREKRDGHQYYLRCKECGEKPESINHRK